MSIRHTVSSVLNRGRTPIGELQPNREEIVHRMYTTLQKSCSKTDEPPKEKHIRNAIVQTHEAKSSTLFWQLAAKLPLAVNAHSCWKFSYLLHKLLREGHHSIFKQSRVYRPKLDELSRYWSHIQGYGPLILSYMKLLMLKIDFHNKYEFLPGSLTPPSNIVPKVGNEPDAQFCFVLDALDYLENLMETQKAIFRTMDRSKNSTSSASGHNRLCACIPIIADSEQLYSFCVKFLSLLHSQLPSEPLAGFRTRFLQIYNDLKTFYEQCVTILYIRQLIQVPILPSSAPDFHSNIPEVNNEHQTLRRANQIEERPPSPEPSTTESLIDVDEDHGISQIQEDQFQVYTQLERAQEEASRLQNELENTKKEQTIEVTKLLEYISQLEREKVDSETSIQTNQATLNSFKTENDELSKKKIAVENAFQQLKMKHMKLVQMHAEHLRSTASIKGELESHETNKKRINSHLNGMFEFLRLQIMKEIQSEKAVLGTRSAKDRGKEYALKLESIEQHPETAFYNLIYVCLSAIQISSEASNIDGNMLDSTKELLLNVEEVLEASKADPKALELDKIKASLQSVMENLRKLNEDTVNEEQLGTALVAELDVAAKLVEESAARIAALLQDARERMTGSELAVHEAILDSCTNLMDFIKQLIITSNKLQKEIVESGRGAGSAEDFYCRNSRWTDGLLSASKAVGLRAQTLTDLADLCVKGQGNFDELIVASREITASTAQLMAASRVKATRGENLTKLEVLSKQVNKAAGKVVGASQSGKTSTEKSATDNVDFSKLSYTQAKKVEMDTQVKILDLEYQLERERAKIREIRKSAYNEANSANPVATKINAAPQKAQENNLRELAAVLNSAPSPPSLIDLDLNSPKPVAAPRKSLI